MLLLMIASEFAWTNLLIPILVVGVLGLFAISAQRPPGGDQENLVAYPKALRVFVRSGWVFTVALVVCMTVATLMGAREDSASEIALAAVLFIGMLSPLHLEVFRTLVTWDDKVIHARSAWRANREVPLSDIEKVDYSAISQWHRIHSRSHGIIRLPDFMAGKEKLLSFIEDEVIKEPPTEG